MGGVRVLVEQAPSEVSGKGSPCHKAPSYTIQSTILRHCSARLLLVTGAMRARATIAIDWKDAEVAPQQAEPLRARVFTVVTCKFARWELAEEVVMKPVRAGSLLSEDSHRNKVRRSPSLLAEHQPTRLHRGFGAGGTRRRRAALTRYGSHRLLDRLYGLTASGWIRQLPL